MKMQGLASNYKIEERRRIVNFITKLILKSRLRGVAMLALIIFHVFQFDVHGEAIQICFNKSLSLRMF